MRGDGFGDWGVDSGGGTAGADAEECGEDGSLLGFEMGEHGECECFVVDVLWRAAWIVGLTGQPFVNRLFRFLRLADVVLSIFFGNINVQLLHR